MFHRKWTRRKRRNRDRQELDDPTAPIGTSGASGTDMPEGDTQLGSPPMKVGSTSGMLVRGQIEGVPIDWKIDTGAKSTFITKESYDMMLEKPTLSEMDSSYVTANGQKLKCYGQANMNITFGDHVYPHVVVVGGVRNNLIGEDFIIAYRCNWDHDESSFIIKGSRIPLGDGKELQDQLE